MRKIDLRPYDTRVMSPTGPLPFDVKGSLAEVLFTKPRTGRELLKRDKLAIKIEDHPDDTLLLEQGDWTLLVEAVEQTPLPGRDYVEFVRRVLEAPDVEVLEKV